MTENDAEQKQLEEIISSLKQHDEDDVAFKDKFSKLTPDEQDRYIEAELGLLGAELQKTDEHLKSAGIEVEGESVWDEMKQVAEKFQIEEAQLRSREDYVTEMVSQIKEARRELAKKMAVVDYNFQKNSVEFDYKLFLQTVDKTDNVNKFYVAGQEDPDGLTHQLNIVTKARRNAKLREKLRHAKETDTATYEEFFERVKDEDARRILKAADQNELEGVPLEEVVKGLLELTKYSTSMMPMLYEAAHHALEETISQISEKEKNLGLWQKYDIFKGVSSDLGEILNQDAWMQGIGATKHKIKSLETKKDELKDKFVRDRKLEDLTIEEIGLLKQANKYLCMLAGHKGLNVPVPVIQDYITNVWMDQNKPDIVRAVGWMQGVFKEHGIDASSKDVDVKFNYVPKTIETDIGSINYDIPSGMCRMTVFEKTKYHNGKTDSEKEILPPTLTQDVPDEFIDAVRYMALFTGQFYRPKGDSE